MVTSAVLMITAAQPVVNTAKVFSGMGQTKYSAMVIVASVMKMTFSQLRNFSFSGLVLYLFVFPEEIRFLEFFSIVLARCYLNRRLASSVSSAGSGTTPPVLPKCSHGI